MRAFVVMMLLGCLLAIAVYAAGEQAKPAPTPAPADPNAQAKKEKAGIKADMLQKDYDASFIYLEDLPEEHLIWMEESVPNRVEFMDVSENSLVMDVFTEKRGYLVLSDTYFPGWKAYDNGKTTKIYRANRVMRAVVLDKGAHRVEFVFAPLSFIISVLK